MPGIPKKLLLCFCFCLGAWAAKAQYRIDQWTAEDGLPQNSISGIVQTDDGYLWVASADGLARFDGARFTVFNKSNSPGIVNNRFNSLFKDDRGDLWAGTEGSGVVRYHNGRFSHFGVGEGARTYWIGDGDADGDPMVLINDWQVLHFANGEFAPFAPKTEFFEDSRDAFRKNVKPFCGTNQALNSSGCYANGRWLRFSPAERSSDYKLLSAGHDATGNIWLITDRRELVRVESGNPVRVFNEATGLPKFPVHFITGAKLSLLSWDGKDSLLLTDLETMQTELLLKTPSGMPAASGDIYPPYAIPGDDLFLSSYRDDEGNLWFGTQRGGLYRVRKQVVKTFSEKEGLTETNVYPIYEDADGTLLVGTTHGLFRFRNGRFAPVDSTENFYVQAIGKDPAGRIVVSSYGDLYVLAENRFVPYLEGQIPASDMSDFIYTIHTDRESRLWIGGARGLIRFTGGAATTFTTAEGLAGNDVKIIIDARDGGLWIGTYGGLSLYKDGKLTSWTENDGLPSRTIRALYEDAESALWIGTYDGGLARFKDGKFTQYNSRIGLYNDGAFQILEDEKRWFWISSNHGIYRVKKDELNEYADGKRQTITSTAYGKSDGMLNAEANGGRSPGGVKTRDGRLWFPTQDGVAMIDPRDIKLNAQPPPVVIESIKIDNNDIGFANTDFGLDNDESEIPNPKSQINIEPSQQNFEITYTALSFINSENLRFKYKLEGLDDEWTDAGTRRLAYFSHVPPGDYTFRVIAANSDGVWNERGATLEITVDPAFYRTRWFLSLSVLSLSGLAFFIYRRRVSRLQRGKKDQEAFSRRLIESQENERKRIAGELHDSLSQNLVIIKNRAMMSLAERDNVDYAFEQIEEIAEAATETLAEVREIAAHLRPFQIDRLGLTKAVQALIRKTAAPNLKIASRIDDIDAVLPPEMQINLYRILQESLNNIIKHSKATKAQVLVEKKGKIINIKISDNGVGFDKSARLEENEAGGFGLSSMSERARILGATLVVESSAGNGAAVSFRINCPNP